MRVFINFLEFPYFIEDTEKIERDDFFIAKTQIGVKTHPLAVNPKALLIVLAYVKVKYY